MKNQIQHIKIRNKEVFSRNYFLRKEYTELVFEVNQTGGEIWAEFVVEFFPNDSTDISIELIEAAEKYHDYAECFISGITSGIKEFKSQLNNQDVGILGMNIRITNLSYHPIDSKPRAYTYPFIALLNRLKNTELFGMEVKNTSLSSTVYNSKIIEYDVHKELYLLKDNQFQLASPKRFVNTLVLSKRIETKIKDIQKGIDRWKITIFPKREYDKRLYTIDVEFRDKFKSIRKYNTSNYIIGFYKQLEQVLREFHTRNINIAGFYVLIEPLYNNEQEPSVKSNLEQLKWIIFSSLLNGKTSKNKKENL